MRCPTCGQEEKRSNDQNSRYWKLLSKLAEKPVQGVKYSSETWHTYCKFKWLGAEDITLPNGKVITQPKSTAGLTKPEFSEYMMNVETWCNEHNVWLDE